MRNYIALPSYEVPRNALLDFSPISQGFDKIRQQSNHNAAVGRELEEQRYQRGRNALLDARAEQSQARQQVEWFGKQALAVDQLQGPERAAAWNRIVSRHPDARNLTPDYLDPINGPKIVAAEAGQVNQPDTGKTFEVDGRLVQVAPGGGVREIYAKPEKPDPIKDMLMRRLQGPSASPNPSQTPMLQPQSYNGQTPEPMLQLTADGQNAAPDQPAPSPDMIDTPYGPMTRKDAQEMGGAMLLDPRYQAAGKALLDSLAAGKGQLSKPAETQLDERSISAASTLGRLQTIKRQFKPEFQQIPEKLKLLGASWGAAFGGKLDPKTETQLKDYSAFKAAAFDNFNQLLKELSGTAVSAQELARQKIVQPNPGEGLFDGDDPVSFMAKIEAGERIARAAVARMNYMRHRGVAFNKDTAQEFLRLEDVPAAMDRRGAEIETELRKANPKADPMSIEREAMNRVRQEFGI